MAGMKEVIAHFDTIEHPNKEEIQKFNRHLLDSVEHQ